MVKIDLEIVKAKLDDILLRLSKVEKEFNASEYDIWTEEGRSQSEQQDFKNALTKYYMRRSWFNKKIRCMVTNEWHAYGNVIAGHIWMAKTRGKGLPKFGLNISDLASPRNGLLVLKDIENAFDQKRLCFLYQPFGGTNSQQLVVKVLDPSLMNLPILHSHKKFSDLDGQPLHCPMDRLPFRRLLGFHAQCSYHHARVKGWLPETDTFEEYFNISDTASAPDMHF